MAIRAVLLDIDGTLLDSNDAHAHAWLEALDEVGIEVPYQDIRERIGMGGDNFLPSLIGVEKNTAIGHQVSERRGEIFRSRYLSTLQPFRGTRELIEGLLARGLRLAVATSSPKKDMHGLLRQAGIDDLLTRFTSADDAENSKPDPDIVLAALKKTGVPADQALMLGDTPYDIEAASKAGVRTIAFFCGGWPAEKLKSALAVYAGPWELLDNLDRHFPPAAEFDRPPLS